MTSAEATPARVFLVGFMGSGKSTVGRLLASLMSCSFVDLDERIEASAGRTISEIFARSGEAAFRRLERRALREVAEIERVVVAAGGGAFATAENRDLIGEMGVSVWLSPDFATVLRRVGSQKGVGRPLFADPERAAELFERRLEDYRQADMRVDVAPAEGAREVAARVLEAVRGESCAT